MSERTFLNIENLRFLYSYLKYTVAFPVLSIFKKSNRISLDRQGVARETIAAAAGLTVEQVAAIIDAATVTA